MLNIEPLPKSDPNKLLTFEEHQIVQSTFIDVFDTYFSLISNPGDTEELVKFIADTVSSRFLYTLMNPQVVQHFNQTIFTNRLLRDFCLELNERFSSEIASIGNQSFKRLIHSLSIGLSECKASGSKTNRPEVPVLSSIEVNFQQACTIFFENPWLVPMVLLIKYFKKTQLGQLYK